MNGIPDPGGAGVDSLMTAVDQLSRRLLGGRDAAVLDAADGALDADDWDNDCWWLDKPAGASS